MARNPWIESVDAAETLISHLNLGDLRKTWNVTSWIAGVTVALALFGTVHLFSESQIDWKVVDRFIFDYRLIEGFGRTVWISLLSMVLGIALGTIAGLMRLSRNPVVASVAWFYVWLFRGTPVLLQILMWFNLALILPQVTIPGLFSVRTIDLVTPFTAALVAFSVNEGAYLAEVIRGGILSVGKGQGEASEALGMSSYHRMRYIILPQAMPAILPAIGNQTIGMLKLSSYASVISYPEMLERAQSIYYVNSKVIELLMVASVWYLLATSIASVGQYYLERYFRRSELVRENSGGIGRLISRLKGAGG